MHYVIIGAGPAGVIAAETLRKTDPEGKITLIGDEPEPPYSRMAIPYLLADDIREEGTYLRKSDLHFEDLGITVVHDRVNAVDSVNKRLTLKSGGAMTYDKLLVASGSRPLKPTIPGIEMPRVHNCWTLEDARNIAELAKPKSNVVLIGAGFIGSIVLEALVRRGVSLSVIEMGDRMVPRMMDATAGGMIKAWCESEGIGVYTSTKVLEVKCPEGGWKKLMNAFTSGGSSARCKVTLDSGVELPADLIICAAGVVPGMDFLSGSGVKRETGVLVNHYLQTSVADIYAAGDVAQGRDFSTGGSAVHAIQPTASEHGRIAALNMAGVKTRYPGSFNMNVLDTAGLISSSFGLWMGVEDGESTSLVDEHSFRYLNLQFSGNVLVGATTIGMTEHVGVLRGLIQGEVDLGAWKARLLEDPTLIMEAYLANQFAV